MWRDLVAKLPDLELHDPATDGSLADIESQLGQRIPISLRELLGETDGIDAHYGTALVWDAEKILTENKSLRNNDQFRTLYMPFDALMFFGDNGKFPQELARQRGRGLVSAVDLTRAIGYPPGLSAHIRQGSTGWSAG